MIDVTCECTYINVPVKRDLFLKIIEQANAVDQTPDKYLESLLNEMLSSGQAGNS